MRIPHILDSNTLAEFKPSPESLDLIGEKDRKFVSENFEWNKDHCPTLADFCVQTISKYFERIPRLDQLPCENRNHLLEILSPDLALEVAVPQIHDEYYWQRRYFVKFGSVRRRKPLNWTWKSLYLERHIREILEQAQPQYNDEENFNEILTLCAPYVHKLVVTQLQSWKPPLTMDKEDVPEEYPSDHINFLLVLRKLPLISEIDIVYGVDSVGVNFTWNMFKISVTDCVRLGRAVLDLPDLKIFRLHRSRLEYPHCQALMQNLIKNYTIVELDLSHCEIGDQGALCVAKFLLQGNSTLKILNLTNNNIRQIGAEGIGFAMVQTGCADLDVLNLKLNPLEADGAMSIMRALVRCSIPRELFMNGCLFDDDTSDKIALMLKMNDTLKGLDISNNWLGRNGGEAIIEALELNTTLEWLDIRDTDVTAEQHVKIEKILIQNRCGLRHQEEAAEEAEGDEIEEKVIDYNKNDYSPDETSYL